MEALEVRVIYGERETDDNGVTRWPVISANKSSVIQSSNKMEFASYGLEAIYQLRKMLVEIEADILCKEHGEGWQKYKKL